MSANYVPAIKSKMGDWIYYITKMTFGEVSKQVELAEEIHPNRELDQLIQRELGNRVKEMTDFLLNESQRFYGSLVVSIYKGNPEFLSIKIDEGNNIIDKVDHSFGLLKMDGSQTYFALDGQHRLESIKAACKDNPDLKEEEISVLVLKHEASKEGMMRTRRLFTKLNRYAKPTDSRTNIVLDEDDCVAINTRRMVREFAPFKNLIKIDAAGKQIGTGKANEGYLTTLAVLYEANKELIGSFDGGMDLDKDYLQRRPDDEQLDKMYNYLVDVWDALVKGIPTLKSICLGSDKPGKYRKSDGGDIWVRPITQLIMAEFVSRALHEGRSLQDIVKYVKKIPAKLSQEPWVNVIWNPDTKRILGNKSERGFLVGALCSSFGLVRSESEPTKSEIKTRYGEYHKVKSKAFPSF